MDIVNFDALIAEGKVIDLNDINPNEDYIIIGKYDKRAKEFKAAKYALCAISVNDLLASSGGGGSTAGSGLSDNGGLIDLGGLLTANVDIEGDGTFEFKIQKVANLDLSGVAMVADFVDTVEIKTQGECTIESVGQLNLNSEENVSINAGPLGGLNIVLNTDDGGYVDFSTNLLAGVRIPRVNGTSGIPTATGMLIYDTVTKKLMFHNGTTWEVVTSI